MSEEIISAMVGILEAMLAECKASARKIDAVDTMLHDKTSYGFAYDHALARVADRANLEAVAESLAALRELLPQTLTSRKVPPK